MTAKELMAGYARYIAAGDEMQMLFPITTSFPITSPQLTTTLITNSYDNTVPK